MAAMRPAAPLPSAPPRPDTGAMEGFVARRDLCSFARLRALSKRSDARGLAQLASHGAAITAAAAALQAWGESWWLALPLQAVLGVLIAFLFCPLHETIHRTAFASRWLNDGLAWLLGFAVLLPSLWFRCYHFEHHRLTGREGDPELAEAKPATRAGLLFYLTGLRSFWWASAATLARHAAGRVGDRFVPRAMRARIAWQARCYLAGYGLIAAAALAAGSWAPIAFWLAPLALGTPALRLYLLAEHTLLPRGADMLANTRTMATSAPLRWLAWQMPYHTEHHLFPALPFHALARAHRLVAPRHGPAVAGYGAFARSCWASLG